jgi:hypothetical protein
VKKVTIGEAPRSAAASRCARIQLRQVRIERQDHERQIGVDDADQHREIGLQHHQRRVDDAEAHQEVVDHPLAPQEPHPGVDTQQKRGPERQDHHQKQDRAARLGRAGDVVGDGIADQQREDVEITAMRIEER